TEQMQSLGESMDWDNTYKTIDREVQKISQLSFIDLYEKGREYREESPAIWCPDCETAISQVEMEDMEEQSHFNDIEFDLATGHGSLTISTTRPELLPACVAVFVHPEDEANSHLVGEKAEVPLFGYEVPILEDERVDMDTGSGVVMSCTFGDQTDIEWYQAHDLPLRLAIDETGTMTELAGDYEGLSTEEARERIVEDLESEGKLLDRWEIEHSIKVHERCDEPIEFLVKDQWFIELLDKKDEYLEAGREIDWYPEKMFTRYKHWIEGLEWDWSISRQRDSGVPIPAWYCEECGKEVIAKREQLPVDPLEDEPPVDECPECGGSLEPDEDVLDTWATSSLTPLINAGWDGEEMKREEVYPMNLRPQGHDIISFWLFHTVVKSIEHTGEVPFDEVMINGMVLDENREKMSKSRGNYVSAGQALEEHSTDALRYWAARTKVGDDLPFQKKDIRAGEKLMRKLWNASKLVDSLAPEEIEEPEELEEIDRWILAETDETVEKVTEMFEDYEFAKARDLLRTKFWHTFCDDYLEIAKQRDTDSTRYALRTAHRKFLKMFAPILSHVTEEIWRDMYGSDFSSESIHRSDWPSISGVEADLESGEIAMEVISALRTYKNENGMALNEELSSVKVFGDIAGFETAIQEVMHLSELETLEDEPEMERKVKEIKLDYSKVGPKYGDRVSAMEDALENNEFTIDAGHLEVADENLAPEEFEVVEENEYTGEGEMLETGNAVVIVEG
ncbi:MAG: valine--tRNA ligase, partial [Candidatus Nanohaloarchaea archaeon]